MEIRVTGDMIDIVWTSDRFVLGASLLRKSQIDC